MTALIALARAVAALNALLLSAGRILGAACMGIMVIVILVQVFFRYVLGSALAWPDETSRFLMLWLTGIMAPTAFRRGGFVAIGMVQSLMPRLMGQIVTLVLLVVSALVLWVGLQIGWAEVTGFSGRFATVSMSIPTSIDFSTWMKVPRAWMMASLAVGATMLFVVNLELILRTLIAMAGGSERLPLIPEEHTLGAE
ncbi:TRAP transporter small permease [Falsirhodobacter algicola]|uniref:TRAP transporter small permease protein n=1 Tax=Falsirhodobacter algicola TaxID=2692330 RepID=A0A8J8MS18_9RHOB|nr:TRAP transporter small permease subunit [Falsirhodobacter algicola]QUS35675.1 TRAP transporter small permease subunit [Falsirhodobacter algicola]